MLLVPVALAATILGLLLAPFIQIPLLPGCSLLLLALSTGMLVRHRPRLLLGLLLVICFLAANLRYPVQFPNSTALETISKVPRKLAVIARVLQLKQRVDSRVQLDLQLVSVADGEQPLPLPKHDRVRLYVGAAVADLLPGDLVSFSSRLRLPRLFGTPGEFHWPRYLATERIALTGWVKKAEQITPVISGGSSLKRTIASWKNAFRHDIDSGLSASRALLVRSLVLGEAKVLPDTVREILAAAGISHLFAISGLHLGLIGMLGYRVLFWLYRRSPLLLAWQPPQRVLPLALLPLLLTYLLLTGDAVSTRRAFCLAAVSALFWLWRYNVAPLRLLMLLALLFLLYNPLLLWHPSWQLSFSGAGGILLWQPLWHTGTSTFPVLIRGPVRLFLVTLAATLATLPLVLLNFHLLAPAGLLVNLVAVPMVAFLALPLGLLGLVFAGLEPLSQYCYEGCGMLLEAVLHLSEQVIALPEFSAHDLYLSRGQYLAVALVILPVLFWPWLRGLNRRGLLFCCWSGLFVCVLLGAAVPDEPALYMLSVGQGESLLVTGPEQAILIDGGGLYSERFDVGKRLLAPALGQLGVRRLSAVLLTHDHPDHRKGLLYILKKFPVDEFWSGTDLEQLHPDLRQVLIEQSIPFRLVETGWTSVGSWRAGELQLFRTPGKRNKNDSSVVAHLQTPAGGVLLTGDLERKGVSDLLKAGLPGPVGMLKLPHHGSRHSGTERLISLLDPDVCLVSAGFDNRYRFPADELVGQLEKEGIPLYRSDIMGSVKVQFSTDRWQLSFWRDGLFR